MLYFMRHGQTDYNNERKWMGQLDIPLNDFGRKQIRDQAPLLLQQKIDTIYTSPLIRAFETATIVSDLIKSSKVIILEDLKERSYGKLEGLKKNQDLIWTFSHEIENNELFNGRIFEVLNKINSQKNILIISHSGVFKAMTRHLGYYSEKYNIENAQILRLSLSN